jgi:hypothetical protein
VIRHILSLVAAWAFAVAVLLVLVWAAGKVGP